MKEIGNFAIAALSLAIFGSSAFAGNSALSGTYTITTVSCLDFLNGESGVSFGDFNVGDRLVVNAGPKQLTISDVSTRSVINYFVSFAFGPVAAISA